MKIPNKLNKQLQKDDLLTSAVHSALDVMRVWFEDNKLVFFPEYTDHGTKHIQEVMESAEALISKESWPIINSEDVATLLLAILLHDCAMHLSEDGFINLVTKEREYNEAFGDKPWPDLWQQFMAEAKRFDERKLKSLFDDTEPVRTPPLDPLEMTKRDRLLIGEFLRRHHPRLAHEIALSGIPGPQSQGLSLGSIPGHIKNLSGIVARSHGMDLRRSVDYLNSQSKWGARRTLGVHVTYLMAIVRIADYLQIHSARAPQALLKVRALRSPVSRGEWSAHASIKDIHQETDDPEAIWVEAAPENVKIYIKLRHLLTDIQRELDACWAVLGEVYAPKRELSSFGLTIRRIKSNLDDTDAFARTVTYVPHQASLETSGAELLKLLIQPLYGDRPTVGIRELLQNAVDACLELRDYIEQHPEVPQSEYNQQDADVTITLEKRTDGTKWIKVADKGIGMSVNTILNYFLKAGASFRSSNAWRRQHENEHGQPRVIRSGRFGIGVLAGFLLGDEIHVTTRHVMSKRDEGLSFSCRLADDAIELQRVAAPIGTAITIQITDAVYSGLISDHQGEKDDQGASWDWFCLNKPLLERRLMPKGKRLKQRFLLPSANQTLPPEWRRIQYKDFDDVHWSYEAHAPRLVCNGIIINEGKGEGELTDSKWRDFRKPSISIFDSLGKLPLNLQRTRLTSTPLPFEDDLREQVCRDFLAYVIVNAPTQPPTKSSAIESYMKFVYKGLSLRTWFCCSKDGISFLSSWHLNHLSISKLAFAHIADAASLGKMIVKDSNYCVVPTLYGPPDFGHLIENRLGHRGRDEGIAEKVEIIGHRILGNRSLIDSMRGIERKNQFHNRKVTSSRYQEENDEYDWPYSSSYRNHKQIFEVFYDEVLTKKWALLCDNYDIKDDPDLIEPNKIPDTASANILITYIETDSRQNDDSLIASAWRDIIRLPYIPYEIRTRKKQLVGAYKELAPYINKWLEQKNLIASRKGVQK